MFLIYLDPFQSLRMNFYTINEARRKYGAFLYAKKSINFQS
jgi:hypothetical protein